MQNRAIQDYKKATIVGEKTLNFVTLNVETLLKLFQKVTKNLKPKGSDELY